MKEDEIDEVANGLAILMRDAVNEDNQANLEGKPALSKLMLVDKITKDLRNLSVQEKFLDIGGISMLGRWLEPLPDKTYPNINVAKEILYTLNSLQIDADNLARSSNLSSIVKKYANGCTGILSLQVLAKQIEDKWSRMHYQIVSNYDEIADMDDLKYKRLKERLNKANHS